MNKNAQFFCYGRISVLTYTNVHVKSEQLTIWYSIIMPILKHPWNDKAGVEYTMQFPIFLKCLCEEEVLF